MKNRKINMMKILFFSTIILVLGMIGTIVWSLNPGLEYVQLKTVAVILSLSSFVTFIAWLTMFLKEWKK